MQNPGSSYYSTGSGVLFCLKTNFRPIFFLQHRMINAFLILKPQVHSFALHGQHTVSTFTGLVLWIFPNKPLLQECHVKEEIFQSQHTFPVLSAFFQSLKIILLQILCAIYDPDIFTVPILEHRLQQGTIVLDNEILESDSHAFPAHSFQIQPPLSQYFHACLIFSMGTNIRILHVNTIHPGDIFL